MTDVRELTMLNERGDTTIQWQEENDDEMTALIQKKMDAGVTFFILPKRKNAKPKKLTEAADARKYRALNIPDADFSKFVLEGKGTAVARVEPALSDQQVKRAKSAREVATGRSVGVKPLRGG